MTGGVLSVRKTLVLGLGSTGLQVAEQVAEHLNWQYGSFERALWVRMLVVETAQPQSPLGDRILWSGMSKDEYLPYLNSPRTTGAEFAFYEWQDGPTLRDIDNPSDGAGNCRMLGRLCLFHPRTYQNLRRRVMEEISALQRLTPQNIADSLGEPGLKVNLHEGGSVVYVVGTLCGGTGSGGAADLGYLLDVWSNNSVRRQAIFTLPHPALQHSLGPRYKKNAFYALRELNHYQLANTVWQQKLPGSDSPFASSGRPYDILRVVMPGGGTGEDVKRLNAMIGQYLAAAVGPAGFDIAASDVDATSQMVGAESIGFMRPLFSTMGVAALEFPGEHVQRAATSRLLGTAYSRWCFHKQEGEAFRAAVQSLAAPDFDTLLQRLTQNADQAGAAHFQKAFKTLAEGIPPKTEQMRALIRDIDGRLTALEPPAEGAAPGDGPTLVEVVYAAHGQLVQAASRDVERLLDRSLFDVDGGPGFVASVLKQTVAQMEGWSDEAARRLPELRQDAETLRSMVDQGLTEVEQAERGFAWNKKEKVKKAWEEWTGQLYPYLAAEVKTQAVQLLQRKDLLRQLAEGRKTLVAQLVRRLEQMQAAFAQEGAALDAQWKELAASSPSVNGKSYFEAEPPTPAGTVTEEYFKLLRQRRWPDEPATGWDDGKKEEAALREVVRSLEPLRAELVREDGQSAFDPRPGAMSARDAPHRRGSRAHLLRAAAGAGPHRGQGQRRGPGHGRPGERAAPLRLRRAGQ
jgi:hypothetical protein